jgi:3-hydroxybutyryl-CoA dehydratase
MITGDKFQHDFTVSDEVYTGFLDTFHDHNPLHTNKEFAVSKGFQDRVMHGNILNGFLSYFIGQLLPSEDVIIMQQDIRFHLPVYLNDVLSFSAVIVGVYESVGGVEFKFDFTNTGGKKVAKGKILIGTI